MPLITNQPASGAEPYRIIVSHRPRQLTNTTPPPPKLGSLFFISDHTQHRQSSATFPGLRTTSSEAISQFLGLFISFSNHHVNNRTAAQHPRSVNITHNSHHSAWLVTRCVHPATFRISILRHVPVLMPPQDRATFSRAHLPKISHFAKSASHRYQLPK